MTIKALADLGNALTHSTQDEHEAGGRAVREVKGAPQSDLGHTELLEVLVKRETLTPDELKALIRHLDTHDVIAKVFLLEGTPFVFEKSPMKYMIFREQVADRFGVGYQDVCIVGSAKLGFSPSPHKFGTPFAKQSDVDVVIISDELFDTGTLKLFEHLNRLGPSLHEFGFGQTGTQKAGSAAAQVTPASWKSMKEAVRNYVFQNFNPGLLPDGDGLKAEIFQKIRSTAPLFMALEPKVFVSKIRCRIFRNWKAAESYYANTLNQVRRSLDATSEADLETDDVLETAVAETNE